MRRTAAMAERENASFGPAGNQFGELEREKFISEVFLGLLATHSWNWRVRKNN